MVFLFLKFLCYNIKVLKRYRLEVRTGDSHSPNRGSIPLTAVSEFLNFISFEFLEFFLLKLVNILNIFDFFVLALYNKSVVFFGSKELKNWHKKVN